MLENETTEEQLAFLDQLRESGAVNMFGAAPYLANRFGLDKREACAHLLHWMKTFADRHDKK